MPESISNDTSRDKSLTISVKSRGRKIDSFDLTATQLIQDCASIGAKIVRKLLTSDELETDPPESLNAEDAARVSEPETSDSVVPSMTKDLLYPPTSNQVTSWESFRQDFIPPYVERVSFTVPRNRLNSSEEEELGHRFPDVEICTSALSVDATNDQIDETARKSQSAADSSVRLTCAVRRELAVSPTTMGACVPLLDTSIESVAETVPFAPLDTMTPRRSLLSRMSIDRTEIRIKGVGSGNTDDDEIPSGASKMHNDSPVLRIAERLGLEISKPRDKFIHEMWLHWRNKHEVKPYATRFLTLEQYHHNLVTLHILAQHKKEFDLGFAVLARFQNTNFWSKGKLPSLSTAAMAYQYLPENSDLCRWIARLFSFLWSTQQYESHEDLLTNHEGLNRDALSKLLFAIAYTRCPFTKGNDAAVIDQWCAVHHHQEGSKEEALCKEMYETMRADPNELKDIENERRRDEAEDTLNELGRNKRTKSSKVSSPLSTPLSKNKRKAESSTTHSHQNKSKRGGGRGGGRGGLGRGPSQA